LRDVNKLISDKLKIGQKLIIPAAKKAEGAPSGAAPTTAVEPVPEAPVKSAPSSGAEPAVTSNASAGAATPAKTSDSGVPHVVMSEYPDLDSIAKLYTVRVEDIVAANKLGTNRTLRVGQKIIIP
jgi:LysM repeat protein